LYPHGVEGVAVRIKVHELLIGATGSWKACLGKNRVKMYVPHKKGPLGDVGK